MTVHPLIDFVEALDRCWRDRRFDDLADFLAPHVVIVAGDGRTRLEGRGAARWQVIWRMQIPERGRPT